MKQSHFVSPRSLREAEWNLTHYYTPPRPKDHLWDWACAALFGTALGAVVFFFL